MEFIDQLRQERKQIAVKARDILSLAQGESRELTDYEDRELKQLAAQGNALTRRIEHEESVSDLEDRTYVPHRPATKPDPDDPDAPYHAPNDRAANARKFRSFGEQLIAIKDHRIGKRSDPRLFDVRSLGEQETIGSDGGFLVQNDFATSVFARAYETGQVANRCDRITIGAQFNATKIPAINESSRVDGSRWGGVLAYWVGEGQTYTGSRPKFRMMDLVLKKLTALCYATDEMLQDSQLLENIIMKAVSEEIGFQLDVAALRGPGAGEPLGVLNSAALVTVAAASGSGVRLLSADVLSMWQHCWAPSRMRAVWFINQDVESQLYSMTLGTATVNQAVYIPPGGLSGAPYATLMGRPVIPIEQCSTLGTPGDVILADMGEYALADKGGLQVASSMHVQFLTDEQVFRFTYRCDGQPKWQLPLTPYKGSNTLSAWTTTAVRT